jgi:hypothetical protein
MSDAGWAALAAIVASICSLLAAIWGRRTVNQSRETAAKVEAHEAASAERGRELRREISPGRPVSQTGADGVEPK